MNEKKKVENVSRETFLDNDIFWTPSKIMGYNCLFNFIVGSTGCGKGYAMTKLLINKAIKEGKEFVHLRRSDVELKLAASKFFDDMVDHNEFPDYHFRLRKEEYQAIKVDEDGEPLPGEDWFTLGYARYLSGARQQKSVNTPKVWAIWFDEFILPMKDWGKYVPDEVTTFLRFYDTVARMRDVRVFFISNAESLVNPYFLYFNIHIPYNTDIARIKQDVAFEMVKNPAFRAKRASTRFGKLIEGTEYGRYALDNQFQNERHTDIAKLDKDSQYQYTFEIGDKYVGVYQQVYKQKYILSLKADKTFRPLVPLVFSNGKLNRMLLSARGYDAYIKRLTVMYTCGFLYYESIGVKQLMEPILCKLIH